MSDYNGPSIFSTDFWKKKSSNVKFSQKSSRGAEFSHAGGRTGGRTDMEKLTVAFRNFANAFQNEDLHLYSAIQRLDAAL